MVMVAPGILPKVICPVRQKKRSMYIRISQPAMLTQVRQDLRDVSMKIW